jgi:hypothetical protein
VQHYFVNTTTKAEMQHQKTIPSNLITLPESINTVYQINMAKQGNDI